MAYELAEAGKFRANPDATIHNNIRILDPDTPGTPATDTVTATSTAAATSIEGVRYTGKDGVSRLYPFTRTIVKTGLKIPYTVSAAATADEIKEAIWSVIDAHEVDAVLKVTRPAATTLTVVHTGSGSLTDLVVDGADVALTRAAVASLEAGDVETMDADTDKAGADTKASSKAKSKKDS